MWSKVFAALSEIMAQQEMTHAMYQAGIAQNQQLFNELQQASAVTQELHTEDFIHRKNYEEVVAERDDLAVQVEESRYQLGNYEQAVQSLAQELENYKEQNTRLFNQSQDALRQLQAYESMFGRSLR